jgi:hypothetical protein
LLLLLLARRGGLRLGQRQRAAELLVELAQVKLLVELVTLAAVVAKTVSACGRRAEMRKCSMRMRERKRKRQRKRQRKRRRRGLTLRCSRSSTPFFLSGGAAISERGL